jgi:hypothetical protein
MSELRAAAERVRIDGEPSERWGATIGGLALVVGLSALDAAWDKNFPTAVVIGPVLTALLASERQTLVVAAAALASALLSAIWNDTAVGADYVVRAGSCSRAARSPCSPRAGARAPRRPRRSARSSPRRSPTSPRR